jgi:hypothetical protein
MRTKTSLGGNLEGLRIIVGRSNCLSEGATTAVQYPVPAAEVSCS